MHNVEGPPGHDGDQRTTDASSDRQCSVLQTAQLQSSGCNGKTVLVRAKRRERRWIRDLQDYSLRRAHGVGDDVDAEYARGVFLATGTAQGRLGQLTEQEVATHGGPPTFEGYAWGLASINKIVRDGVKPGPVAQEPQWTERDFEALLDLMVRNYRIHATGTGEHDHDHGL